jgi:hypothetical protein
MLTATNSCGTGDRRRVNFLLRTKPRQAVDDRPKVRAAITEKIFDPARAQNL